MCDALGILGRPPNALVCEAMSVDAFWEDMAAAVDAAASVIGGGDPRQPMENWGAWVKTLPEAFR